MSGSQDEGQGGFIQFPLCVLSQGGSFEEVMNAAIYYSISAFIDTLDPDNYADREEQLEHARRTIGFKNSELSVIRKHADEAKIFYDRFVLTEHKPALAGC